MKRFKLTVTRYVESAIKPGTHHMLPFVTVHDAYEKMLDCIVKNSQEFVTEYGMVYQSKAIISVRVNALLNVVDGPISNAPMRVFQSISEYAMYGQVEETEAATEAAAIPQSGATTQDESQKTRAHQEGDATEKKQASDGATHSRA